MERFLGAIKQGLPKADQPQFLERLEKTSSSLRSFIEDFRSRFGQYEQAIPVLEEAEKNLKLYNDFAVPAAITVKINSAVLARKPQSCLVHNSI